MPHDSLHTVSLTSEILGVQCNGCGHRAVLGATERPKMHKNMTLLRSLKLKCKNCGLSGTGKKQFTLIGRGSCLSGRYLRSVRAGLMQGGILDVVSQQS